ncbi:PG1 protein, partial [Bifidobacterium lemurum]
KAVYNPKASIPHAASLHQACAHCAIFPTAASRRSLGRISVPMWPVALSGRLPVEAMVGRYPAIKLIGRDPIPCRESFPTITCDHVEHPALPPVSRSYSGAWGRSVTHYSPVRHSHHQASLVDPVRLACVKHAASVHPEPESNPPQKNLVERHRIDDSQTIIFQKKMTSTSYKEGRHSQKPHHPLTAPADPAKPGGQ